MRRYTTADHDGRHKGVCCLLECTYLVDGRQLQQDPCMYVTVGTNQHNLHTIKSMVMEAKAQADDVRVDWFEQQVTTWVLGVAATSMALHWAKKNSTPALSLVGMNSFKMMTSAPRNAVSTLVVMASSVMRGRLLSSSSIKTPAIGDVFGG